ncbi:MAG: hypothetical protein JWN94_1006 [Betaproteobacteria bacterium]|nr:hypothetical protein [Betaproteobacteria bacterium]
MSVRKARRGPRPRAAGAPDPAGTPDFQPLEAGDAGNLQSEDNTHMNEEQPSMEQPVEAPPVDVQRAEHAASPPAHDPRRRLRELLAIPERDRSDPVWDEIISLEIETAPGNRLTPQDGRHQQGHQQGHQEGGRRQDGRRPDQQQPRRQDAAGQRPKSGGRFFKKRKRGPGAPA